MTPRERTIFLRGIAVGMNAAAEFETSLEPVESVTKQKPGPKPGSKKVGRKGKKRRWTDEEKQALRDNLELSNTELHELLPHRSSSNIAAMKSYLGLKRTRVEEEDNGLAKLNQ